MSWFSSSPLGRSRSGASGPPTSRREAAQRLDAIRARMGELVRASGASAHKGLALRIQYAGDVQALWFMRSEVMAVLARSHGEQVARERLVALGEMFDGLLPEGLRSRPSPLDDGAALPDTDSTLG
ncbi:hypothetical protein [Ramlibacter sp.]|uniref:hypothetical protein n=1 Tax=Ramlibacter sp. TaxID=1917967 RepID=UPI003D123B35